jgi:flagellar biosynthesis protein FlhG
LSDFVSTQAESLVQIARYRDRIKKYRTKLLTVTSGKGGVGKSTFVSNVAYILAKRGFKVCVLDADIGLANLQIMFDVKPQYSFFDYVEGRIPLRGIFTETQYNGITLIAGASGHQYAQKYNRYVFSSVVEDIVSCDIFDYVLVDTGAGVDNKVGDFLEVSDNILALTTPDPSALTDVYALIKMVHNSRDKLFLCFNHTKNYEIGYKIWNSIKTLMKKNGLNENFMVEYVGNLSFSSHVSNMGRIRKIYTKETTSDSSKEELELVVDTLLAKLK